ncbi:SPRY domain-containing protein 7 [Mytilus coruscus]|uniref:SPRY domain-containing protein 7 n=1 Tax=Mytilus coruscus TaxID=42192 RepID=A0A6J8CJ11_MYTCO|nr:SPRY domain-containing protein 7 [Mytilus coruscus]
MSDAMACFKIMVKVTASGHSTSPKTTTRQSLTNLLIMLLSNAYQVGVWGVGLATKRCNVNKVPLGQDSDSWVVNHDAVMYHNKEQKGTMSQSLNEGDILGITYDHVHLNFYLNGQPMNCPFSGMKGTVYPVFYVDEGAVLDVQFDHFYHQPPEGFDSIMIEQSLL